MNCPTQCRRVLTDENVHRKSMEQRELRLMSELVSSLHSQQRHHTSGNGINNGQHEHQEEFNFAPSTPGKISNKLEMKIAARYR